MDPYSLASGRTLTRRGIILGSAAAALGLGMPEAFSAEPAKAKAKRYRRPTKGSSIDTGGAVISIDAPIDRVMKVVLDFRKYRHILPRLEQSRVLGVKDGKTDVYLRAPILNGAVNIWGIARFSPPVPWRDEGKMVVGEMVKGNLDAWYGAWMLEPASPTRTSVWLEMFVDPQVPMPDSWITPELEWAADKGVTAVRALAEG
jgi:ribosome-associated toxin RatA of RatAB toxin-antitoxin module